MRFNYGNYLRKERDNPPSWKKQYHAHHILFKRGFGSYQKELVNKGQEILRVYNIDPIKGLESIVWAPNIKGLHCTENLEKLVDDLINVHNAGLGRTEIIEVLNKHGEIAFYWGSKDGRN
ncbi:hypothetical protein [Macrococcoides canis]|uniref:hypothetical protein n=1 Tax=Macrococcoides canis TaxID=1855823 RepID=UPI001FCED2A7|nr:hypothetical protein [Macrococcus canis]